MDTHIGSVDGPASNHTVGCLASSAPAQTLSAVEPSLGRHLARRLVQVGINDVFAVPGDFNLALLDHLIAEPGLRLVGCCNELNAGYAADGYARARGVGACAVTFTVGGLSVINAIAGAYSENLPVICIAGGPNSNDYGTNRVLHHTIGLPDFTQELRCFQTVTCYQAVVNNLDDAHEQIDTAISTALRESKPVYLSISCNLPGLPHPTFTREPVPFFLTPSNKVEEDIAMAISISSIVSVAGDNKRLLLVVAAIALVLSASPSAVSARRRPVRLRLYMHDIVGGPGQTAVRLVKGPGPENPSMHPGNYFGDTVAVDDLLTADLAVDSAPVGRAQGTYMTGSMRRPVFVVAVTLLLTTGPYNGSTLVVAGHDDTSVPVRELAVVGGTGALRRAAGYVLWSTARVESALHAVLLLDVHASVPATSKAAAAAELLVSSA